MGVKKIVQPMLIAVKSVFQKPFTLRYPEESIYDKLPENFKQGRHIVDFNLCVGCQQCARICPSECIEMISIPENKGGNTKVNKPLLYPAVSLETCMWCNLCEEICPTTPKAIRFSKLFENSNTNKAQLVFHPLDLDEKKYSEVDFVKPEEEKDVIEGKRAPTQKTVPPAQPSQQPEQPKEEKKEDS